MPDAARHSLLAPCSAWLRSSASSSPQRAAARPGGDEGLVSALERELSPGRRSRRADRGRKTRASRWRSSTCSKASRPETTSASCARRERRTFRRLRTEPERAAGPSRTFSRPTSIRARSRRREIPLEKLGFACSPAARVRSARSGRPLPRSAPRLPGVDRSVRPSVRPPSAPPSFVPGPICRPSFSSRHGSFSARIGARPPSRARPGGRACCGAGGGAGFRGLLARRGARPCFRLGPAGIGRLRGHARARRGGAGLLLEHVELGLSQPESATRAGASARPDGPAERPAAITHLGGSGLRRPAPARRASSRSRAGAASRAQAQSSAST